MTHLTEHLEELESRPLLSEARPEAWLHGYQGYRELLETWVNLTDRGVREHCLGYSVDGEPLFALEIGPSEAEQLSVVIAGLHAMEWIGVEVAMRIVSLLADDPPADQRVLCVPVVNVDGYRRVEAGLREGRRSYVRANSQGVDLNRNWPTSYRRNLLPGRILPWLGNSGEHARSAPEVDAVCAHLDGELERGTTIRAAVSLHSIGRMLLLPYGGQFRRPEGFQDLEQKAEQVRRQLSWRYRISQVSRWLPGFFAFGMEIDHFLDCYGAKALLVECTRGGVSLGDPSSWITPFRWYNPPRPDEEGADLARALEGFLRE